LAIPLLSEAVAVTVIAPDNAVPASGEVIETVGWLGEELFTVIDSAALVPLLFEVSVATAVNVCLPLATIVVFRDAK
jgi:hypothetical protein